MVLELTEEVPDHLDRVDPRFSLPRHAVPESLDLVVPDLVVVYAVLVVVRRSLARNLDDLFGLGLVELRIREKIT